MVVRKKGETVYYFMSAGWGPLIRGLPVIDLLIQKGSDVVVHIEGSPKKFLQERGYRIHSPKKPNVKGDFKADPYWKNLDHLLVNAGYDDHRVVNSWFLAYQQAIRDIAPDLIFVDFNFEAAMVAKTEGIPLVSIAQSLFLPWRKTKAITWWESPSTDLPSVTESFNEIMKKHGAQPIVQTEELLVGDITCIPSFPEFDPVKKGAPVHYVGPIIQELSLPFNHMKKEGKEIPQGAIVIYPGRPRDSAGESGIQVLEMTLNALKGYKKHLVVATGGYNFGPLQKNTDSVTFHDWLPMNKALDRASLIVHHGGHGTCLASILSGVPSLVIPTFTEREYNARQLQSLGVGICLPLEEAFPEQIQKKVADLLFDPAYQNSAQQWAEVIAARSYGGAQAITALTQDLLKNSN